MLRPGYHSFCPAEEPIYRGRLEPRPGENVGLARVARLLLSHPVQGDLAALEGLGEGLLVVGTEIPVLHALEPLPRDQASLNEE